MAVLRVLSGTRPQRLQGWDRGAWDVAASLGYVACDKPGLARLAELCCSLDCCGLGSCQYFQEKEEGREAEAALPSHGCSPCLPGGCQGQLSSSQGTCFVPLELLRPLCYAQG